MYVVPYHRPFNVTFYRCVGFLSEKRLDRRRHTRDCITSTKCPRDPPPPLQVPIYISSVYFQTTFSTKTAEQINKIPDTW